MIIILYILLYICKFNFFRIGHICHSYLLRKHTFQTLKYDNLMKKYTLLNFKLPNHYSTKWHKYNTISSRLLFKI